MQSCTCGVLARAGPRTTTQEPPPAHRSPHRRTNLPLRPPPAQTGQRGQAARRVVSWATWVRAARSTLHLWCAHKRVVNFRRPGCRGVRYYHWHYHHLMSYYVVLIHNTTATRSTGGAKGALAWMRHCGCLQTILRTELTELCACVGAQHCDSHAHGSHPQGTALRAAAEALSGSAPHQNPVVCRARGGSCAVAKASVAWWARVSRRPRAACSPFRGWSTADAPDVAVRDIITGTGNGNAAPTGASRSIATAHFLNWPQYFRSG